MGKFRETVFASCRHKDVLNRLVNIVRVDLIVDELGYHEVM